MKTAMVSFAALLSCLMLLVATPGVAAYAEISIGATCTPGGYSHDTVAGNTQAVNPASDRVLEHSSGKIVVLHFDADVHLWMTIYRMSDWSKLYQAEIDNTCRGGAMVKEYSATQVIVVYATSGASAKFRVYNVNTYNKDIDKSCTPGGLSGATTASGCGNLFYYNGYWYAIFRYYSYYGGSGAFWGKMLASGANTCTVAEDCDNHPAGAVEFMGFQNPNDAGEYYYVTSAESDGLYPEIHKFDADTSVDSVLGMGGLSGTFPMYSQNYQLVYTNRLRYLGGGIYDDPDSTEYILYLAWAYPNTSPGGNPFVRTYQVDLWRGRFNNTISTGSLLEQCTTHEEYIDESLSTYSTPGCQWGYVGDEVTAGQLDIYYVYNMFWLDSHMAMSHLTVPDLRSFTESFPVQTGELRVDNAYIAYLSDDDSMAKDPRKTWSYHEEMDSTGTIVDGEFENVLSMSEEFAYSPNDSPYLKTKNTYTFTWTIYRNGIADSYNDSYRVFVDNFEQWIGQVNPENGEVSVPVTVGSAGTHQFLVMIYDENAGAIFTGAQYTLTFRDTESVPIEDPNAGTQIARGYIQLFQVWLPMLGVVMVPAVGLAILGARLGGGLGMVIGLLTGGLFGTIGGVVTMILPTYALYLYILLLGLGFVIAIRSGSSGGG